MRALPASLRLLNQRRLLERLVERGTASRAELADGTGMSRPTAGKIIDELLAAGVVEEREGEPTPGRLGRPGRLLGLESRTPRFLLVELGVRRTELAAVPLGGSGDQPWRVGFATPRSEEAFRRKLAQARAELGLLRPWAFALSAPGVIDERSGLSRFNPNLHWTEGVNLLAMAHTVLRAPGCVVQEIRALALGHRAGVAESHGADASPEDFLLVDADDGVGAAALVHGQIVDGALAFSAELGHTRVAGNDRACGCGAHGCVETLLARPGLLRAWTESDARRDAPATWSQLIAEVGNSSPRWLGHALAAGATVIGGALNVLGLDRVVLTGAFEDLPARALDGFRRSLEGGSLAARFGQLHVDVAPRRRARGLVRSVTDRLLIPTADWSEPCAAAAVAA